MICKYIDFHASGILNVNYTKTICLVSVFISLKMEQMKEWSNSLFCPKKKNNKQGHCE